jgi:hypothetical protein
MFGVETDLYAKVRAVLESSRTTAAEGAQRLARLYPDWRVTAEAMADSPGWGLVERARTWQADLIVVGAHSHTPLQRFFFGSATPTIRASPTSTPPRATRLTISPHAQQQETDADRYAKTHCNSAEQLPVTQHRHGRRLEYQVRHRRHQDETPAGVRRNLCRMHELSD